MLRWAFTQDPEKVMTLNVVGRFPRLMSVGVPVGLIFFSYKVQDSSPRIIPQAKKNSLNAIKQAIRDTRELGTRLLDLGYRLIHALRASCFMDIIIGLYPCKSYSVFRPGTILDLIIKQMERDSFFDKSAVRAAAYSAMLGGFVTR